MMLIISWILFSRNLSNLFHYILFYSIPFHFISFYSIQRIIMKLHRIIPNLLHMYISLYTSIYLVWSLFITSDLHFTISIFVQNNILLLWLIHWHIDILTYWHIDILTYW
jgi:hypothetical protein